MKKIMLLIFGLVFSSNMVNAAPKWTSGHVTVKNIIWRPGFYGFYAHAESFSDPDACAEGTTSTLYTFPESVLSDHENLNKMFTILTTAMVAKMKINAYVDGCRNKEPQIIGLQLNPA